MSCAADICDDDDDDDDDDDISVERYNSLLITNF